MKSGFSGLKLKSSQQLVPSLSERLRKSCKNQSRILWFYGRAGVNERRTLVDRNVSKQEMQWLSISWNHGKKSKRRQPRELKHKIKEANEHKLECKLDLNASTRQITEIKTRRQIHSAISTSKPTFSQISIFRIGTLEMLQHANSS